MRYKTLMFFWSIWFGALFMLNLKPAQAQNLENKPNVILIYADDLGYGDLSSYGATKLKTPHIDALAAQGTRFTNAHSSSATCTPSRFALMTGVYPWRQEGTGILPGDAKLIIPTDRITLPKVFQRSGYKTAVVGKWHLGLGGNEEKNWNKRIALGPNDVGFDFSFIFPATNDRVPTVFLENQQVIGLDPADPLEVNYKEKIGNDPTALENPELLKIIANFGHKNTIVNGLGRIGFMKGGHQARWVDEEITPTFLHVSKKFIRENRESPFFLFFSLNDPHAPRVPTTYFKGKSGLGPRGDAILQLDWTVGEIMRELRYLGIDEHTIVIFSSDNGAVLIDDYEDGSAIMLNGHLPSGSLRGGKYSVFEGGTRVPFIVRGLAAEQGKVSDALIGQTDILASMAEMLRQPVPIEAIDSEPLLSTLLGKDEQGRAHFIEHAGTLAVLKGRWKYIAPSKGPAKSSSTDTELGNLATAQLYDLREDVNEQHNVASKYPKIVRELEMILKEEREKGYRK